MAEASWVRRTWAVVLLQALVAVVSIASEEQVVRLEQGIKFHPIRRDLLWCKAMGLKYTVDEMRKGYYYPRGISDYDDHGLLVKGRAFRAAYKTTCEVNQTNAAELARSGFEATGDEKVQTYKCDGGSDQKWMIERQPKDSGNSVIVKIKSDETKMCLDFSGYEGDVGAYAGMYPCRETASQEWELEPDGDGKLRHSLSKLCLQPHRRLLSCELPEIQKWKTVLPTDPGLPSTPSSITTSLTPDSVHMELSRDGSVDILNQSSAHTRANVAKELARKELDGCLSLNRSPKQPITYVGWEKVHKKRCIKNTKVEGVRSFRDCAKFCHDTAGCYAISYHRAQTVCRWSSYDDCKEDIQREADPAFDTFVNHGYWDAEVKSPEPESCAVACRGHQFSGSMCIRANKGDNRAVQLSCDDTDPAEAGQSLPKNCFCRRPYPIPKKKWVSFVDKDSGLCLTFTAAGKPVKMQRCVHEHTQMWRVDDSVQTEAMIQSLKDLTQYLSAVWSDDGMESQSLVTTPKISSKTTERGSGLQQWRFGVQGSIQNVHFKDKETLDVCVTGKGSAAKQALCEGKGPSGQKWNIKLLQDDDDFMFQAELPAAIWYVANGVKHSVKACQPCGMKRNVCATASPAPKEFLASLTVGQPYACDVNAPSTPSQIDKDRVGKDLVAVDNHSNRRRAAKQFYNTGFRTGLASFPLTKLDREAFARNMDIYSAFLNRSMHEPPLTREQKRENHEIDSDNKVQIVDTMMKTADAQVSKEVAVKVSMKRPPSHTSISTMMQKYKVSPMVGARLLPAVRLASLTDWKTVERKFNAGLLGEMVNLNFMFREDLFSGRSSVLSHKILLQDGMETQDIELNYFADPDKSDTAYWELSNFWDNDGTEARLLFEARLLICSTCNCPGGKLVDAQVSARQVQRPSAAAKYRAVKGEVDSWAAHRMGSVEQTLNAFVWTKLAEKVAEGCSATTADVVIERKQKKYMHAQRIKAVERAEKARREKLFKQGLVVGKPVEPTAAAAHAPMEVGEVGYKKKLAKKKAQLDHETQSELKAKAAAQKQLEQQEERAEKKYSKDRAARIAKASADKLKGAELKLKSDTKIQQAVPLAQKKLRQLEKKAKENKGKIKVIKAKLYDSVEEKNKATNAAIKAQNQLEDRVNLARMDVVSSKEALRDLKKARKEEKAEKEFKEERAKRRYALLEDNRRLGESQSVLNSNSRIEPKLDTFTRFTTTTGADSPRISSPLLMTLVIEAFRRNIKQQTNSPHAPGRPISRMLPKTAGSKPASDIRLSTKLQEQVHAMANATNDKVSQATTEVPSWKIVSSDGACALQADIGFKLCGSCSECKSRHIDSALATDLISSRKHAGFPESADSKFKERPAQESCELWYLIWRARLSGMLGDLRGGFLREKFHRCQPCLPVDKELSGGEQYFSSPITSGFAAENKENLLFFDLCKKPIGRSIPIGCCGATSYSIGRLENAMKKSLSSNAIVTNASKPKAVVTFKASNASEVFPSDEFWKGQLSAPPEVPGSRCVLTKNGVVCDRAKILSDAVKKDKSAEYGAELQAEMKQGAKEGSEQTLGKRSKELSAAMESSKKAKKALEVTQGQLESQNLRINRWKKKIRQASTLVERELAEQKLAALESELVAMQPAETAAVKKYGVASRVQADRGEKVLVAMLPSKTTEQKSADEAEQKHSMKQARVAAKERYVKLIKWRNTAIEPLSQHAVVQARLRAVERFSKRPVPKQHTPLKIVRPHRESPPVFKAPTSQFPHKEAEVKHEEQEKYRKEDFMERKLKMSIQPKKPNQDGPVSLDAVSSHELSERRFKAHFKANINNYEITCDAPCLCKAPPNKRHELSESKDGGRSAELEAEYSAMVRDHVPHWKAPKNEQRLQRTERARHMKKIVVSPDWTHTEKETKSDKVSKGPERHCLCCKHPKRRVYRVGFGLRTKTNNP